MLINDPDGDTLRVSKDHRLHTVSVVQTDVNALAEAGTAWTLAFTQAAADATDNVVFHIKNNDSKPFELMRLLTSNVIAGTWSVEYGREYSAGGTAMTLGQLNVKGGKSHDISAYYGQDITLTGTAKDIYYFRLSADTPYDLLNYAPIVIPPSGTVSVRFNADSGTPIMTFSVVCHGENPWD